MKPAHRALAAVEARAHWIAALVALVAALTPVISNGVPVRAMNRKSVYQSRNSPEYQPSRAEGACHDPLAVRLCRTS